MTHNESDDCIEQLMDENVGSGTQSEDEDDDDDNSTELVQEIEMVP